MSLSFRTRHTIVTTLRTYCSEANILQHSNRIQSRHLVHVSSLLDPSPRLEILHHILRPLVDRAIRDAEQLRSLRRVIVDDMCGLLGIIRVIPGGHVGIEL